MGIPAIDKYPLSAATLAAYRELAVWLARRHSAGVHVFGINGAQGSGKSTLAVLLAEQLGTAHGLSATVLSLDDFYLAREARDQLAVAVHPLLATRGVPGTHDARRGLQCLQQLSLLMPSEACRLPQFCKASDDVMAAEHDRVIAGTPDIVLFEGWCVGTPPQEAGDLMAPINELERVEDPDARWRQYVNRQLEGVYASWFSTLDVLIHLQVPSWQEVRKWRAQQEKETAARNQGHSAFLDDGARERFLQHYQRLTQHAQRVLPDLADVVLTLDTHHNVSGARYASF